MKKEQETNWGNVTQLSLTETIWKPYSDEYDFGIYEKYYAHMAVINDKLYFTPHGLADFIGVNTKTIQGWCKVGKIKHLRDYLGFYYISVEEATKIKEEM